MREINDDLVRMKTLTNDGPTPPVYRKCPSEISLTVTSTHSEVSCYKYNGEKNCQGERHGYGTATLQNGDTYRGEYRNGIRHGYGEYAFYNHPGAIYCGNYVDNKKNGYGIFKYPDNSRYEGGWKNDKRHGQGCYYYCNGDVYKGEWAGDSRHGQGEYIYANEEMKHIGMWRHGKRSGEGKLVFKNNYYKGHFLHDRMLGPGTYVFSNGTQQDGEYVIEQKPATATNALMKNGNNSSYSTETFFTEWRCKNVKLKK